jgi:hypothetical protein
MAAGLGFKTFTTGEVLTAADTNGYLMQGVLVFASAAARNAAITSPQEGQFAYTKDTNGLWYYDGAAWVASGATGDIEGVTAGVGITGGGTSGTVTITNDMATTITAAGDIVVGTGSGTYDNLPIGTTAQVLTADTTVSPYKVKWATPSSSTPAFVGCGLTKSSSQSIATGTETKVTFQTEKFDTDGFHTGSDARITIPSGKAGKYLITGQVMCNSTGYQTQGGIKINGSTDLAINYISGATPVAAPCMVVNNIVSLAVADYIELFIYQASGVNKDVLSDAYSPYSSYFSVQYLGA